MAKYVAGIERESCLDRTDEEAVNELKFGLTEVVYHWALGEVCMRTHTQTILIYTHAVLDHTLSE